MRKFIRTMIALAVFSSMSAPLALAQEEQTVLKPPIWVPAEFLVYGRHDEAWLFAAIDKLGAKGEIEIGKGMVGAKTLHALKALNRLRGFANLDAESLQPPYLDLTLKDASGGTYRCVTKFPKSIVPSIRSSDFAETMFADSNADADLLARCKVKPEAKEDFTGLDREVFRDRYFGPGGHLRDEFANLTTNTAFIAEAIDHGFYVTQAGLTGRLQLDAE